MCALTLILVYIEDTSDFALLVNNLLNSTADVVVLFGLGPHVDMLLTEVQTLYTSGTVNGSSCGLPVIVGYKSLILNLRMLQ